MRIVLTFAAAVLAAPDRPDLTPREQARPLIEQIVGEWAVVKRVEGGIDNSSRLGDNFVFSAKTLHFVSKNSDPKEPALTFVLDASSNPATLDLSSSRGANFDMKGIIKVEGDLLTLCVGLGGVRPPAFESRKNSAEVLLQMKRARK